MKKIDDDQVLSRKHNTELGDLRSGYFLCVFFFRAGWELPPIAAAPVLISETSNKGKKKKNQANP